MLVPYDPQWPHQFEVIAAELRDLGDGDRTIEHIGSTAVPGMRAKPIIDIAVRITDEAEFERHCPQLEYAGWRVGSSVRTHPVMVFETRSERTRIAHFFSVDQWDAVNQRAGKTALSQEIVDRAPRPGSAIRFCLRQVKGPPLQAEGRA